MKRIASRSSRRHGATIGLLAVGFVYTAEAQCPPYRTFVDGSNGGSYGRSVAGAGDVDGDGFSDLIIGEPGYDGTNGSGSGKAHLYSGLAGQFLMSWEGEARESFFGHAVDGAGDVDGDGFADLVIGAFWHSGPTGLRAGKAYVFSGASGQLIWSWDGEGEDERFGWSVSSAGDVDRDGCDDVIIGAPGPQNSTWKESGKVYVYSGATGEILWFWHGDSAADRFGYRVSGAGDVNGDGHPDLIVGAYWADGQNGKFSGKAYVYCGARGQRIWTFEGEDAYNQFGSAVCGMGDVNRDGFDDVLVGAHSYSTPNEFEAGKAYVYSGATGELLWCVTGQQSDEFFGFAASGAGDFNCDGVSDVIVGSYGYLGAAGDLSGKAYVFSGSNGQLLQCWEGEGGFDFFGFSVSGAGDVNNDGVADVIVGAPLYHSPAGPSIGKAYIYLGGPTGDVDCDRMVSGSDILEIVEAWGPCVAPSGSCGADINFDGVVNVTDLLIVIANWGPCRSVPALITAQ